MKEFLKASEIHGKIKPLSVLDFSRKIEKEEVKEITFTQEDLEKTESEAYSKGFTEGLELGTTQGELKINTEIHNMTQEMLSKIDNHLAEIKASENLFIDNFFPNIIRVCHAVLEKAMPHFFKKYGKEEMAKIIHEIIISLTVKVPIQVKISKYLHENLPENIQKFFSSYSETIDISGVSEFSDGMCEINWDGGGAKWNLDARYEEINNKLQQYLNTCATKGEHHG